MRRILLLIGLGSAIGCTSLLGDFTLSGAPTQDGGPDAIDAADVGAPCSSPKMTCGTTCVDPSSDPANCGVCGHDCQGPVCTGGVCGPVSLLQAEVGLYALTIDNQNVYWTQQDQSGGGLVKELPLAGAPQPTTLGGTQAPMAPTDLVLDGQGRVWFVGNDTKNNVWQLFFAKIGSPGSSPASGTVTGAAKGLASDGAWVYAASDDPSTTAWVVAGYPTSGGPPVTLASGSGGGRMMGVASGPNDIAWANQIANSVYSAPKGSINTMTALAGNMNLAPGMISAAPNAAFWTSFGSTNTTGVWSGQFGVQGSGQQIAKINAYRLWLATDNALLFFSDGTGTIGTLTFDGKQETDLYTNRAAPGPIAVNATYVVWYEQGTGTIYKAVR